MRGRLPLCVAVVLLGACSASSAVTVGPPADVSTPSGDAGGTEAPATSDATGDATGPGSVAPVEWGECESSDEYDVTGWECGTVEVPLDYTDPSGRTISVALTRAPATDDTTRIGSLFVNPGGPGGSGIETVHYLVDELPENVKARFDIVGFDPRGVGASTAVDCVDDKAKDAEADLDPTPDTPTEVSALTDRLAQSSRACAQAQGDLLPYVGTMNAARDLDRLREAVGDDGLTYLGFSYGTILGATYASLFPDKARALVLDGATDPASGVSSDNEASTGWYGDQDFDGAFSRFDEACQAATDCAAQPSAETLLDQVRGTVEKGPIRAPTIESEDGRQLTSGLLETGVSSGLYDAASWPFLAVALKDAAAGDGSVMIRLADNLNRRRSDGSWDNLFDAFRAVACADFAARPTAAEVKAELTKAAGEELPADAPNPSCTGWPETAEALPSVKPVGVATPVLVIGTRGDPATPYENAPAMVDRLQDAVLLTWEGDGHTAFPKTDCVNAAVTDYVVDLEVPEDGMTCPAADDGSTTPTEGSAYALDREMLRRQIEEGFTQNGTDAGLAECIAKPLSEELDEDQMVHFFLGLDAEGLQAKLSEVVTGCGGQLGS
jgi:pimeloyl-ACP methyl ester carboxylesterase